MSSLDIIPKMSSRRAFDDKPKFAKALEVDWNTAVNKSQYEPKTFLYSSFEEGWLCLFLLFSYEIVRIPGEAEKDAHERSTSPGVGRGNSKF